MEVNRLVGEENKPPSRKSFPKELFLKHLTEIKGGDQIAVFFREDARFELKKGKEEFILETQEKKQEKTSITTKEFATLEDFWDWFQKNGGESSFIPEYVNKVLAIFIITFNNLMREEGSFSYKEYSACHKWEEAVGPVGLSKEYYWQFCIACCSRIEFTPKFPKRLCKGCEKEVSDIEGNSVHFVVSEKKDQKIRGYYSSPEGKKPYSTIVCCLDSEKYIATKNTAGKIYLIKAE